MNVFLLGVLIVVGIFIYRTLQTEGFGFSNGTMIQLRTSHVPTTAELEDGGLQYARQVKHDLAAMTF